MKWDEDNDQLIAIMEKTRLYIFRDQINEEPVITSGYICQFRDLTVRTVLLDEIMPKPEQPAKNFVVDIEIKALRDAKDLLQKENITLQEAAQFIDSNPHPKLW